MKTNQTVLKQYRLDQMMQFGFWIAGPVAIVLVLQAGIADYGLYPQQWNFTWLVLRIGIIPIGLFAMFLYRHPVGSRLGRKISDFPILMVVGYIALLHLWIIRRTGFENSSHFHAFPQCILGLAMLPFRPWVFAAAVIGLLGSYFGFLAWHHSLHPARLFHGEMVWTNTYVLMGILFYVTAELARRRAYRLREELEDEVAHREEKISNLVASQLKLEGERITADLAAQVAHDIRSPLTALRMFISHLPQLSEPERQLGNSAIRRLTDIAGLLLSDQPRRAVSDLGHPPALDTGQNVKWLYPFVDRLILEKRVQYRNREGIEWDAPLTKSALGAFISAPPEAWSRMLSNLLDNAVESIEFRGRVEVNLATDADRLHVTVSDTGRGIPPEILPKLMARGATFGKPEGNGLGLFHAQQLVSEYGGNLTITSVVGKGTQVSLTLPMLEIPNWFTGRLDLRRRRGVVMVDDDPSVHELWRIRLGSAYPQIHFADPESFRCWYLKGIGDWSQAQFLFDYELRSAEYNGIKLIREFSLAEQSILVTHSFEDETLLAQCAGVGISLIPKSTLTILPILF